MDRVKLANLGAAGGGEAFVPELLWEAVCNGLLRMEAIESTSEGRCLLLRPCATGGAKPLTERERQVIDRIAAGACPTVVGFDLEISASTVASHLASALHKLTKGSRLELYEAWTQVHDPDGRLLHLPSESSWIVATPKRTWPGADWLTPAQLEVVECLMRGLTNAEIAAARSVSTRTVANQLAAVFQRLRIADRNDLALLILRGQPRSECQCA